MGWNESFEPWWDFGYESSDPLIWGMPLVDHGDVGFDLHHGGLPFCSRKSYPHRLERRADSFASLCLKLAPLWIMNLG